VVIVGGFGGLFAAQRYGASRSRSRWSIGPTLSARVKTIDDAELSHRIFLTAIFIFFGPHVTLMNISER
jgi:hypothetical protein